MESLLYYRVLYLIIPEVHDCLPVAVQVIRGLVLGADVGDWPYVVSELATIMPGHYQSSRCSSHHRRRSTRWVAGSSGSVRLAVLPADGPPLLGKDAQNEILRQVPYQESESASDNPFPINELPHIEVRFNRVPLRLEQWVASLAVL
jgi:hypothetical protein